MIITYSAEKSPSFSKMNFEEFLSFCIRERIETENINNAEIEKEIVEIKEAILASPRRLDQITFCFGNEIRREEEKRQKDKNNPKYASKKEDNKTEATSNKKECNIF